MQVVNPNHGACQHMHAELVGRQVAALAIAPASVVNQSTHRSKSDKTSQCSHAAIFGGILAPAIRNESPQIDPNGDSGAAITQTLISMPKRYEYPSTQKSQD